MKKEEFHKKSGKFKLPEGYFGNFEDRLFEKIREESTLPRDDGFNVPRDYFDNFEDRLFQKLHNKKAPEVIRLSTYKKIYYTVAAAAAILVLFVSIKFLFAPSEITYEISDIEIYIDNGYMALNSYDIAEIFNDETLEITSITGEDNIDDEKLVEYLYENLDDYNDLVTEN